jgi:hypothetical protein
VARSLLAARDGRIRRHGVNIQYHFGGAVAQLGARLDGIEEVVGSNPIGSTNLLHSFQSDSKNFKGQ